MNILTLVLAAIAAAVGVGVGRILGKAAGMASASAQASAAAAEVSAATARHAAAQQRADDLATRNLQQESELRTLRELHNALELGKARADEQLKAAQLSLASERAALTQAKEELTNTFKALAAEALHNCNQQFLASATEKFDAKHLAIDTLLQPVKKTLEELHKHNQHLEVKREGAYAQLGQQLSKLGEDQASLQQAAVSLSSALRNTRTTGKWGEIVLRRVAELAGMTEHCDFSEQHTQDDSRPDMIIKLPNGRRIIVDAKTTMSSFHDAADCADDKLRQQKLEEHARNIRTQAMKLAKRRYDKEFEDSIDLTVCFIPGDVYYFAALQADHELFEKAAAEKIIFATPTTLIALLKAAAFGWQQDSLRREAKEILLQAQQVYDRLTTAASHFTSLGNNLNKSVESYDKLIGSLERSVFPPARRMKELGISGETLPAFSPLDKTSRSLQAADWRTPDVTGLTLVASQETDPVT